MDEPKKRDLIEQDAYERSRAWRSYLMEGVPSGDVPENNMAETTKDGFSVPTNRADFSAGFVLAFPRARGMEAEVRVLLSHWIDGKALVPSPTDEQLVWLRWIFVTDPYYSKAVTRELVLDRLPQTNVKLTREAVEWLRGILIRRLPPPSAVYGTEGPTLDAYNALMQDQNNVFHAKVSRYKHTLQRIDQHQYDIDSAEKRIAAIRASRYSSLADKNEAEEELKAKVIFIGRTKALIERLREDSRNQEASLRVDPYLAGMRETTPDEFVYRLQNAGLNHRVPEEQMDDYRKDKRTPIFHVNDWNWQVIGPNGGRFRQDGISRGPFGMAIL